MNGAVSRAKLGINRWSLFGYYFALVWGTIVLMARARKPQFSSGRIFSESSNHFPPAESRTNFQYLGCLDPGPLLDLANPPISRLLMHTHGRALQCSLRNLTCISRTFGPAYEIETPATSGLSRMGLMSRCVYTACRGTDLWKIRRLAGAKSAAVRQGTVRLTSPPPSFLQNAAGPPGQTGSIKALDV